MKIYNYSVSTNTIWTSFDFGEIEAKNIEDAKKLAIEKLKYDFDKANETFKHSDLTKGFSINFDSSQVQITERT